MVLALAYERIAQKARDLKANQYKRNSPTFPAQTTVWGK